MLIITPTQLIYCVLLIANSCRKGLELAILPDIFLGQRFCKKTDFYGVQVVANIQRGQLGCQLARTISALAVTIFEIAMVDALVVV